MISANRRPRHKHVGANSFLLPDWVRLVACQYCHTLACEHDENDTRAQAFTYTHTHTLQLNPIGTQFYQRDLNCNLQEHSAPSLFSIHVNDTCHFAAFAPCSFACIGLRVVALRLESIACDLPLQKFRCG